MLDSFYFHFRVKFPVCLSERDPNRKKSNKLPHINISLRFIFYSREIGRRWDVVWSTLRLLLRSHNFSLLMIWIQKPVGHNINSTSRGKRQKSKVKNNNQSQILRTWEKEEEEARITRPTLIGSDFPCVCVPEVKGVDWCAPGVQESVGKIRGQRWIYSCENGHIK